MTDHKPKRITRAELEKIITFYSEVITVMFNAQLPSIKKAIFDQSIEQTMRYNKTYLGK